MYSYVYCIGVRHLHSIDEQFYLFNWNTYLDFVFIIRLYSNKFLSNRELFQSKFQSTYLNQLFKFDLSMNLRINVYKTNTTNAIKKKQKTRAHMFPVFYYTQYSYVYVYLIHFTISLFQISVNLFFLRIYELKNNDET